MINRYSLMGRVWQEHLENALKELPGTMNMGVGVYVYGCVYVCVYACVCLYVCVWICTCTKRTGSTATLFIRALELLLQVIVLQVISVDKFAEK